MGDENLADDKARDDEKVSLQGSCGKDEIVEELRNCLPKWVTQEQVTDMIRGTCRRNVVEIADDFYEHETIFYEQVVPADVLSLTSSRDGFGSGKLVELLNSRDESSQSSQLHKLKSISSSSQKKMSLSTVKRKRKKKGKAFSKFESVGPKQASITKFFNKVPSDDDTKA